MERVSMRLRLRLRRSRSRPRTPRRSSPAIPSSHARVWSSLFRGDEGNAPMPMPMPMDWSCAAPLGRGRATSTEKEARSCVVRRSSGRAGDVDRDRGGSALTRGAAFVRTGRATLTATEEEARSGVVGRSSGRGGRRRRRPRRKRARAWWTVSSGLAAPHWQGGGRSDTGYNIRWTDSGRRREPVRRNSATLSLTCQPLMALGSLLTSVPLAIV